MKMISFVSFKGGAGKSTALMAVASALVADGHRIALLEADENRPLEGWRRNALKLGTWDDANCRLLMADSFPAMQAAFASATAENRAYALVDTAGGGSELNTIVIAHSELVIIPTSLNLIDLDNTINTLQFIGEQVASQAEKPIEARILLTRFPQSALKSPERANLEALELMPQLTRRLRTRSAFADLKSMGLLHLNLARLADDPGNRLAAGHIRAALAEASDLTREILAEVA